MDPVFAPPIRPSRGSYDVGVTLAAVHYFYMRVLLEQIHASPIVCRYIDWCITVPLQMVEFYLILQADDPEHCPTDPPAEHNWHSCLAERSWG